MNSELGSQKKSIKILLKKKRINFFLKSSLTSVSTLTATDIEDSGFTATCSDTSSSIDNFYFNKSQVINFFTFLLKNNNNNNKIFA